MKDTGVHNGAFGADRFGFKKLNEVKWNLGAPALYEFAIAAGEATEDGTVVGGFLGRRLRPD